MARLILFLLALVLLGCVGAVSAEDVRGDVAVVRVMVDGLPTRLFEPRDVEPVVDGGPRDATYRYRFARLESGQRYSISVQPKEAGARYGVGVAVDGRCILTGEKVGAEVQKATTWPNFYVVDGWGGDFRGWREDSGNIRRFVATNEERSLAATLWNDKSATGTIVVSVFRETPAPEPIIKGETGVKGLGTAAGEREESRVVSVKFIPRPVAYEVFVLRYATKPELEKLGVWADETPSRFWPPASKPFIGRIPQ